MKKEKHFRILPDFMIRTAMLPLESINEIKTGDEFLTSLEKFIDEGVMGEAILVASSSLSNMLEKSNYNQKDRNSIAFSLYKYISRTFSRTTPFGLFASVGMGTFDNIQKNINFQELEFKKNSRIDMEWLLGFIDSMEKEKHIVAQLRVKANHTIVKSGKRMELLFPTHCGQGEKIEGTITDTISIRLTDASKYTLEKAKEPIVFSNLVDDIYEQYGKEIDRDIVFNFVWEMFRQEFLISELRPPLLGENPVDYLIKQLNKISGVEKEICFLQQLQKRLADYDNERIGNGLQKYRLIDQQMQGILKTKSSLQVDTVFSNIVSMDKKIAEDFEEVIEVMCRITPITQGYPYMKEYYLKFIEKYGTAVDVPILDLVNANIGIGYPTYYSTGQYSSQYTNIEKAKIARRKRVIRNQIESSIINQFSEIVLDDKLIASLTLSNDWENKLPESMEIYGEIIIPSQGSDNREAYTIIVNPNSGSFQKGLTLGRFANFSKEIKSTVKAMAQCEQELNSNTILVDVTYIPTYGRTANIMMSKNCFPYEMAIGTNIQDNKAEIRLDDIYVCADNQRLFLKSKSYGKEVRVMASNMLNFASSPYLYRLLRDLSYEMKNQWQPFVWDNEEKYIFTPRLRYKNVVIVPAQWNLYPEMFEKEDFKSEETFFTSFQNIVRKWGIPKYVFVKFADNHILLDITMKEAVKFLRKDLNKGIVLKLEEMVGTFEERTLFQDKNNHYMTEVVFEVEKKERAKKEEKMYPLIKYEDTSSRILFPGEEWLYINLYCPENTQNELLRNKVVPFADKLVLEGILQKWFFIRYDDGKPHIRLRLRVNETKNIGGLLNKVLDWLKDCKKNGEIFDANIKSYERESARYGGPQLIEMAESVFWRDSQLVIKMLDIFEHESVDNQKILVVLSVIKILEDLGFTREAQLELLDTYVDKNLYKQEFRPMRKRLLDLISQEEGVDNHLVERKPMQLFFDRTEVLNEYGRLLQQKGEVLWNNVFDIASSLLHMHFNRIFGVNREKEKEGLALTRHTIYALSQYEKNVKK